MLSKIIPTNFNFKKKVIFRLNPILLKLKLLKSLLKKIEPIKFQNCLIFKRKIVQL